MDSAEDTTVLLQALSEDPGALNRLMPRIYDELRILAHRELARRGHNRTLRTTGLVHEAYSRLVDQKRVRVEDRAHFFALSATAMRHIVIDRARRSGSRKRGGDWKRVSLGAAEVSEHGAKEMIDLHNALTRLEKFDQRLCKVVECRVFAGLTVQESAIALGVSPRTIDRAWQKAKAWLYREMQ